MPRKALIIKAAKTPKFSTRLVRRCGRCGRRRGYLSDFNLCRICFRQLASEGSVPGVKKASW